MTTGDLLKSLLKIADMNQKSFAESIFTSPSKISKLANGKLLIGASESRAFAEQAASIFSDEIYEINCHFKFKDLFPFIFEFSSRYELYDFLVFAFLYTTELDREENDDPLGLLKQSKYYVGSKQLLYIYCIVLSEYHLMNRTKPLVFYSSLQHFYGRYSDIFDRVKILKPSTKPNITLNQFFSDNDILVQLTQRNLLKGLFVSELHTDYYRWQLKLDPDKPFLMLDDEFIMLFDHRIDDTLQMALIRSRVQLEHYNQVIMNLKQSAKCRSYNTDNIRDYLKQNELLNSDPRLSAKLAHFMDAEKAILSTDIKSHKSHYLSVFLDDLLSDDAGLFLSADLIRSFLQDKDTAFARSGTLSDNPKSRTEILQMLRDYLRQRPDAKVKIANIEINALALLCTSGWTLIVLFNPGKQKPKFHFFNNIQIQEELSHVTILSDFSTADYIDLLLLQMENEGGVK